MDLTSSIEVFGVFGLTCNEQVLDRDVPDVIADLPESIEEALGKNGQELVLTAPDVDRTAGTSRIIFVKSRSWSALSRSR